MNTVAGLLILALLSVVFAQSPSFQGSWTSDYGDPNHSVGARFYFCFNPATSRLQGVYSNIGFVDGFVVNDTATGRPRFNGVWFEGGPGITQGSGYYPNYGPITLLLSADGNSFSGSYANNGNPVTPGDGQWTETRVGSTRPTDQQCWFSETTSAIPDRVWEIVGDATWSFCSGSAITKPSGGVVSSYSYSDNTVGSTVGNCNSTAGVCSMIFSEKFGDGNLNSGIMLLRVVGSTLYMSAFTSTIDDFVYVPPGNDAYGFSQWTLKSTGPTLAQCTAQQSYVCKYAVCPGGSPAAALAPLVALIIALIALIMF